jgi:hypothetical protein
MPRTKKEPEEKVKKSGLVLSIWTKEKNGGIVHVHTGGIAGEVDLEPREMGQYEAHVMQYGKPIDIIASIGALGTPKIVEVLPPGKPKFMKVEVLDVVVNGLASGLQEEYISALTAGEKAEFSKITFGKIHDKVLGAIAHGAPWSALELACQQLDQMLGLPLYKDVPTPLDKVESNTIEGAGISLRLNGHLLDNPTIELRACPEGTGPSGYLRYCYWLDVPVSWAAGTDE